MRTSKIRAIATFEFITTVKRPGYLIATFGMPVFMALYGAVVAIPAYFASRAATEPAVHGVVDPSGLLGLTGDVPSEPADLPAEVTRALEVSGQNQQVGSTFMHFKVLFRPFATEADARAALAARTIKGYVFIPLDYLTTGAVDVYGPDSMSLEGPDARDALARLMRQRLLRGRVDDTVSARVLSPLREARHFSISRAGEITDGGTVAGMVRLAVPLIFMVLFLVSVLMTSGYLMQGTATEKENKVVEVLLSSANPEEILSGKLLGLGGAGLLQIAVWFGILVFSGLGVVPLLMSAQIAIPWTAIVLALPLFLVAFLFYGSLMLGTGSLGSNMREAQQLAMVWSLTAAMPMIMMTALIRDPNGIVARVLTLLPFSSASLIIFRASTDAAALAWWEIATAFGILVVSTWLAIRIGARLFRIGLVSASRPKLREILRQARLSA